ncbi:hypothetical protein BH20ACT17_BH20ACT17_18620 [soil metagenome]
MVDPRIYRAAMVPVLFALILLAFSLENRPRPLTTTLAPDAFEGQRAYGQTEGLRGLADRYPDRRPGSVGDERLADNIAGRMGAAGFRVRGEVHDGDTIDGRQSLRTVIAERAGTVDERVVVVAHRDAAGRRAAAELSATAALLELARVFGAPRQTRRSLMLVSTSGGSGGAAGAAVLADQLKGQPVAAVLVLGDLASSVLRPPLAPPWSNALGASPLRLRSTVQEAIRRESGTGAGQPRALSQLVRHALPATYGEQGVLLERGIPAILLSVSGDRPPAADAPISQAHLQSFGRVALRTVTVLDAAPPGRALAAETTSRDLLTNRKVLPGWAVRLFIGALLLPPLLAAVDGFAAIRRRRAPVLAWLRWALVWSLPFIVAALFAVLLAVTGLLTAPGAPVSPAALPVQLPALLAVALVFGLAWWLLRPALMRLLRAGGELDEPGAGSMVMLLALATTIVLWIGNPYAAALVVLAMHAGLWALAPDLRLRRSARLVAIALGALPMAIAAFVLSRALGLDALDALWLLLLLVASGDVSALSILLWSLLAGCAVAALVIAARRDSGPEEVPITVRGPATYAGPGSLGGTESALKR